MSQVRTNFLPRGNDSFECHHCGALVQPLRSGFRNHCPECLWSRHVDQVPGDRASACGALMEPVALEGSEGSGWFVVHRCQGCGFLRRNSVCDKDPCQPDRWDRLIELSTRGRGGPGRRARRAR